MICGSFKKLEVGKSYPIGTNVISDDYGNYHRIPHRIMREASMQEYIDELVEVNIRLSSSELNWLQTNTCFFYEISVD